MLKTKVFSSVPKELMEFRVNRWLEETYEEIGFIDILSVSQSKEGKYVVLRFFYKES